MPWPGFFAAMLARTSAASLLVRAAAAQQRPGVPFHRREEAIADLSFGREPQTVAVAAEGMGHGVDESDSAAAVEVAIVGRGLARIVDRQRLEPAHFAVDDRPHAVSREDLVHRPAAVGVERHVFDEPQLEFVAAGELGQRHDFILRDPADGNSVQANALEARLLGGEDSRQHAIEPAAA